MNDLFAKAVETAEEGIGLISPQGEIIYMNEGFSRQLGYSPAQVIGKTVLDFLAPEGVRAFQERKEKRVKGELRERYEMVYIHGQTKELVYGMLNVSPIKDKDGQVLYSLGMQTDITNLKKTQIELDKNISWLKKAQKIAGFGFWEIDLKTERSWWSEELILMMGLAPNTGALSFSDFLEMVHADDRGGLKSLVKQAGTLEMPYTFQYRLYRPDGELRYLRNSADVEKNQAGEVTQISGIVLDVTDEIRQDQTIEQQRAMGIASARLSTVGEMAGGIAHEINTPLSTILLSAEMIKEKVQKTPLPVEEILKRVDAIMAVGDRIALIVKGLRQVSRDASGDDVEAFHAEKLVHATLNLCNQRFANHGIDLQVAEVTLSQSLLGQFVPLTQVLFNLLNNSYDAICDLDKKWISIAGQTTGNFFEIVVTDSGAGVPPAIKEKLFQPFFTTKPVGVGTGLGLSVAKGIMQSRGGDLLYDDSCPNTRFIMKIPLVNLQKQAS